MTWRVCMKAKKPVRIEELSGTEKRKYEIAEELGLLDQVLEKGWKSLSARESGKIGGILSREQRNMESEKTEM